MAKARHTKRHFDKVPAVLPPPRPQQPELPGINRLVTLPESSFPVTVLPAVPLRSLLPQLPQPATAPTRMATVHELPTVKPTIHEQETLIPPPPEF